MTRWINRIATGGVAGTVGVLVLAVHAGGQGPRVPPAAKTSVNACLTQTGSRSWCGDNGVATEAKLAGPSDVAIALNGDLLIADTLNNVVRSVRPQSIVSIGGTGARGTSLVLRRATTAAFAAPEGVAAAVDGSVLVADTGNDAVRSISATGFVTTLVSATGPIRVALDAPRDVVALADGSYLVSDSANHRVLRIATDAVTTVAGTGAAGYSGDGGPAVAAQLQQPAQIAMGADGSTYIADAGNGAVRRVLPSGVITTVTRAVAQPAGVHVRPSGEVLVSSATGVWAVASDATAAPIAGGGAAGFDGDGGPALGMRLDGVAQIAERSDGTLLFAERGSDRIRSLDAARTTVATVAGDGTPLVLPKQTIPRRPFPPALAALTRVRPARTALVAQSAQSSNCKAYDAQFATFNLHPATKKPLKRKPRRELTFSFKTSRKANVQVELFRNGKRIVHKTRKNVPNKPKTKAQKINVKFKKDQKIEGKYVLRLWGIDVDNGVKRCDDSKLTVK